MRTVAARAARAATHLPVALGTNPLDLRRRRCRPAYDQVGKQVASATRKDLSRPGDHLDTRPTVDVVKGQETLGDFSQKRIGLGRIHHALPLATGEVEPN